MNDASAIWLLLGWLSIIAGAVVVVSGIGALQRSKETWAWPSTQGRILSSAIKPVMRFDYQDAAENYEPIITYNYVIAGKIYEGKRIRVTGMGYNKAWAQGIAKRYRTGRTVTVYYDPGSPEKAVLERGTEGVSYFVMFTVGASFLTLGIFFLLSASRPNHPAGRNAGSAPQFAIGHQRPDVPQPGC
jgi:hypothetical protein